MIKKYKAGEIKKLHVLIRVVLSGLLAVCSSIKLHAQDKTVHTESPRKWKIEHGKFYENGEWVFLKIAKPLLNFTDSNSVAQFTSELDMLKSKSYNTIEINCYWHQFDRDGNGTIDVSLAPLNRLIYAIYDAGMYPCLSVETYSIGGGLVPEGFWTKYPDAQAIDSEGKQIQDDEYGTETGHHAKVVSIYHTAYQNATRTFIKNLARSIDTDKILYFETTVEPQFLGIYNTCYSASAKEAYSTWRRTNDIADAESEMPDQFPIPQSFMENETWNRFRAESLAQWVNGDALAYREISGPNAYIAVDVNDAEPTKNRNRLGNPAEFLKHLHTVSIIQLPGHWWNGPNKAAYQRVWEANRLYQRDWAITEHMTFNGLFNAAYDTPMLSEILMNTIKNGTRFGWEFTNVDNKSKDVFTLYNDDWSPKRAMALVDENWTYWLNQIQIEEHTSR
ncbi:MAG TPA: hypothetical protein PKA53_04800 [Sphingobacterium sp.]|nr:hypothetical protein [Sphingobacterium sp.]